MTKTLLERAKSIKPAKRARKAIDDEFIELALAWLKGEIDNKSLHLAMGYKQTSYNRLYMVSVALKSAYEKGLLKIT